MKKRFLFISFFLFIAVFFLFFTQREVKAYCSGTYTCIQTALDCRKADGSICTAGTPGCTCTLKSISQTWNCTTDPYGNGCYASGCGTGTTSVINNCNSQPPAPTSTPIPTPIPGCTCYYNTCMGTHCQQGIPCPNCVFPGNGCTSDANCGGGGGTAPTCTLSGPSQVNIHETGSFTATATGHGDTIKMVQIWRAQTNNSDPTTGWKLVAERRDCNGDCTLNGTWTPADSDFTSQGNKWWLACNAYYINSGTGNATNQCSGNPFITFPYSGWSDCDANGGDDIFASITGWIQGRVATNGTTPYWKPGGCAGCSGSCANAPALAITCNGRAQNFGCNSSGAKYDEGGFKIDVGTSSFCAASGPPSGYQFTGWSVTNSRPSGNVSGPCSGNFCNASFTLWGSSAGDNNVWFSVGALPTPTPTPANSPPAAPSLSSPAYGSTCQNTSLTLTWNGVSSWGACYPTQNNQYKVYLGKEAYKVENGDSSVLVATLGSGTTSYTASGLTPNTAYYWRVRAINGCLGTFSSVYYFTTKPNPPASPTCYGSCSLAAAPGAPTSCSIDWNDIPLADHYPLRIDESPESWLVCASPDVCVDVIPSIYNFTGKGGYSYKAWVHTYDRCTQWSVNPVPCYFTAPYCPLAPSSCSLSSPGIEANDNITVSWPDVAGNESYKVERNGAVIVSGLGQNATSYTDAGAKACGTYTYRVASVKAGCTPDKWVGCGSVVQMIKAPTNLVATRTGCNVGLTWADNSNIETSFVIDRQRDFGSGYGGWELSWASTVANVTTKTDSNVFCGANPARAAKYRVYAKNTALFCTSAYSNEASAFCPLDATTTTLIIIPDPPPPIVMAKTVNEFFSYNVGKECGTFDHIEFSYDPNMLANVTPTSSTSSFGIVGVTAGMTPGNTKITAKVYLKPGPVLALTRDVAVKVIPPDPWWQTKDGDVHADGSITSLIPVIATVDKYLSLKGAGGMPGVVSWNSTNPPELDAGSISETNWQAQTTYHGDHVDFDYLMNRLNVDTSHTLPGQDIPGSGTWYAGGSVNLNGRNVGSDKVVIFVNGDATVQGNITVSTNGFFALIAKNGLTFAAGVTKAQGFYLSSGAMSVASGTQLFEGEGSFIAWGEVSMGRDLGPTSDKNQTPAETFLFRPDLLVNAPKEFLFTPFVFQEVAP